MGRRIILASAFAGALLAISGAGIAGAATSASYLGNGATGFGGPVGQGSLTVSTDGAGNLTMTLNTSAGHPSGLDGNNLVVYISTGAAGLSDTSSLIDTGSPAGSDYGHVAISGYNNFSQNPATRTVVAFPTGFAATYAISFANAYDGLFMLPTDNSGLLTYVDGKAPVNSLNTLTIPLSELGLTQGQSFSFVGTDIDGSAAYRSNEAFGDATVNGTSTSLAATGNPGFNNLVSFSDYDTFSTATPEPFGLAGVAGAGALLIRRRRTSGTQAS